MGGNYSAERKGEALQTDILQRCTLSHKWYMGFVRFHSFGFSATRVFPWQNLGPRRNVSRRSVGGRRRRL